MAKKDTKDDALVPAPVPDAALIAIDPETLVGDGGFGFEDMAGADRMNPFIVILQKGSPQIDEGGDKYVEGAKVGSMFNTVLGTVYDGKAGIEVISCGFKSSLVRWKSRDSGGGLVGHLSPNDPVVATARTGEKNKLILPDGDELIDTAYHFVLIVDPDDPSNLMPAVIAMSSTNKAVSRRWNTQAAMLRTTINGQSVRMPMFASRWQLTTKRNQRDQYTWYTFEVAHKGYCSTVQYQTGKAFAQEIKAGAVQVGAPPRAEEADANNNDNIPF